MANPNQGELIATVWERKIGSKPTDNIYNSRNLFFALGKNGFRESADGGRLVEMGIEYAQNSTFRSYSEFEELDTTRINVFDVARYEWKIAGGTVVYSELERLRWQGSGGKYNVLEERLENGKDSHIQDLNEQFWGDGTASANDVIGIQALIDTTPATGTVGGINAANFSFWRNRQNSGAQTASAYDNLRSAMTTTFNQCALGNNQHRPTDVATDQTDFEAYEQLLVAIEQINADKKRGNSDIAFPNEFLRFKGARVWYDEDAPASNMYMFNNRNLKVVYLKGGWMKMYPEVDPHNQLANVHKVATFCTMVTNARRHLGVVNAIT